MRSKRLELYQAKFQNRTGQEWFGTIKTKLVNGAANTTNQVWDANEEMKNLTEEIYGQLYQ